MQDQHVQNKLAVKYLNIINFANFLREKNNNKYSRSLMTYVIPDH